MDTWKLIFDACVFLGGLALLIVAAVASLKVRTIVVETLRHPTTTSIIHVGGAADVRVTHPN